MIDLPQLRLRLWNEGLADTQIDEVLRAVEGPIGHAHLKTTDQAYAWIRTRYPRLFTYAKPRPAGQAPATPSSPEPAPQDEPKQAETVVEPVGEQAVTTVSAEVAADQPEPASEPNQATEAEDVFEIESQDNDADPDRAE